MLSRPAITSRRLARPLLVLGRHVNPVVRPVVQLTHRHTRLLGEERRVADVIARDIGFAVVDVEEYVRLVGGIGGLVPSEAEAGRVAGLEAEVTYCIRH